jgi:predicted ArsR family transcriptional regulator
MAYAANRAASPHCQGWLLEIMREMGQARLDDLAEFMEVTEMYVRINAEILVERGELTAIPARRGRSSAQARDSRIYMYGDGSPEQGSRGPSIEMR